MTYQKDDNNNLIILHICAEDMQDGLRLPPLSKADSAIIAAETGCAADMLLQAAETVREKCTITFAIVAIPDLLDVSDKSGAAPVIETLRKKVDSLILVQKGKLDQAVESLSDLMHTSVSGTINLDAADLKTMLLHSGPVVHLGTGAASGKDEYEKAVDAAAHSDLTGTDIKNARSMIVGMTAAPDLDMANVTAVMVQLQAVANPDTNIIFALDYDERMTDAALRLTVLACNYEPQG